MDIDLLSKMVKELILDNDKVVLPGLGTFVAEFVPAAFSDRGFTINPPYRKLYFRTWTGQDRALAELYSRSNGISPDVAERVLADFLSELKTVLKEKKTVVFPGLGRLRATKENNFFFVPEEDLDIYPEGVGLAPISLKSHQETREEVAAAMEELKTLIVHKDEGPVETDEIPAETGQKQEPEECPTAGTDIAEDADIPEDAVPEAPAASEEPTVTVDTAASVPADTPAAPVRSRRLVYVAVAVIAVAVLAVVLFVLLSRLNPGLFDQMLYNEDQLRVLDYLSE